MSTLGGKDYTNFKNLRVKGDREGSGSPGIIRFVATDALESTLSVNTTYQDSSYRWYLPAKTGQLGVSGTFTVNLLGVGAGSFISTAAVVSGIRAEDGLIVTMMGGAYETAVTTNRGFTILGSSRPTATGIEMVFLNPTATASAGASFTVAYTAIR